LKENLFYNHEDKSNLLLQGEELEAITHTRYILLLQDAEDSLDDEYNTVTEPSRIENGPSLGTPTKPYRSYNKLPLLLMPAITASPDPDTRLDRD
jgi:hypothetical protein